MGRLIGLGSKNNDNGSRYIVVYLSKIIMINLLRVYVKTTLTKESHITYLGKKITKTTISMCNLE